MFKCKNSDKGTYKGTEPSPKGRGYCAKGEKNNKKMKGNDGNIWIINETKTGVKRWVKFTKKSKINKSIKKSKNPKNPKKSKNSKKSIKKNKSLSENLKQMTNIEVKKYLNKLPKYIENSTNYSLWKSDLGPNEWYYDKYDYDIILKILKDGLDKLFKVKIKKNNKNKTYEFTIERKKKYPIYNIVSDITLSSGGPNNTEILINNKKVSKKDFKNMQKNNKYIYVIDNVDQNKINLRILITQNKKLGLDLDKNCNM